MPDAGLNTMRCVESGCKVPLGAGVLTLLMNGMAGGVFIDQRSVADGVEATHLSDIWN
jgi:hypothetical protein